MGICCHAFSLRYRAVSASLILGLYWWLWHLPLVWTEGSAIEGQPLWLLLFDLLAKSLIFTYVFLGTQGSVLLAILLHASTNLFAVSPRTGPDGDLVVPLVALVLKFVLAAALFVHLPRSFDDGRAVGNLPGVGGARSLTRSPRPASSVRLASQDCLASRRIRAIR